MTAGPEAEAAAAADLYEFGEWWEDYTHGKLGKDPVIPKLLSDYAKARDPHAVPAEVTLETRRPIGPQEVSIRRALARSITHPERSS